MYKTEKLTLGTYEGGDDGCTVSIGMTTLKNKKLLIYVLAHELAHFILQGQHGLFFNEEKMVEIVVLATGFGAYWADVQPEKKLYFENFKVGYFTEEEGAYVLAKLQIKTGKSVEFSEHERIQKIVDQLVVQIKANEIEMAEKSDKEKELLPDFLRYCVKMLENEIVDISIDDTFLNQMMLYCRQAEKRKCCKI